MNQATLTADVQHQDGRCAIHLSGRPVRQESGFIIWP